jgi:hypothetical protein
MPPMSSGPTSNNSVVRKQLSIILWAEVALMGVLVVDFALRPLFSVHGFGLLIVGTAAAVQVGMAVAIFAARSPSGARGGQLTAGEGWAIGISLVAVIALLIGWVVELPHPDGLLLVITSVMTLSILGLVVAMRRRRA